VDIAVPVQQDTTGPHCCTCIADHPHRHTQGNPNRNVTHTASAGGAQRRLLPTGQQSDTAVGVHRDATEPRQHLSTALASYPHQHLQQQQTQKSMYLPGGAGASCGRRQTIKDVMTPHRTPLPPSSTPSFKPHLHSSHTFIQVTPSFKSHLHSRHTFIQATPSFKSHLHSSHCV
jgi:hypothetical protein